jgi:hypothetical protein
MLMGQDQPTLGRPLLAEIFGKRLPCPDQLAHRCGLHLSHHITAVELDGNLADAELEGDRLVESPTRDLAEYLPLTRCESGKPLRMLLDDPPCAC